MFQAGAALENDVGVRSEFEDDLPARAAGRTRCIVAVEDGHGKATPGGALEIPGEIEAGENIEKELLEAEADLERYLDTKGSEVLKWEHALEPEPESGDDEPRQERPATGVSVDHPVDVRHARGKEDEAGNEQRLSSHLLNHRRRNAGTTIA